jgi:hypothetical protein
MSMPNRNSGQTAARVAESLRTPDDGDGRREPVRAYREMRETKPSVMTTEFWAMLAGIVGLFVLYNLADNPELTLWRTCLLSTVIAAAYIVSRGWAKSGSRDDVIDRY